MGEAERRNEVVHQEPDGGSATDAPGGRYHAFSCGQWKGCRSGWRRRTPVARHGETHRAHTPLTASRRAGDGRPWFLGRTSAILQPPCAMCTARSFPAYLGVRRRCRMEIPFFGDSE